MRIGIVGSLSDPELMRLRRSELIVTAQAGAPAKLFGSLVQSVPASGVALFRLGGVLVVVAADFEAAARGVKRSTAPTILVVGPRGAREHEALAVACAGRRTAGSRVEIVEISGESCVELAIVDRAFVGLPAEGATRSFLPREKQDAPNVPRQIRVGPKASPYSPAVLDGTTSNPAPGITVTPRAVPEPAAAQPQDAAWGVDEPEAGLDTSSAVTATTQQPAAQDEGAATPAPERRPRRPRPKRAEPDAG
jgi:hypothetical protein